MRAAMPSKNVEYSLTTAAARDIASFEVGFIDSHGQPTHAEDLDVYVERVVDEQDRGTLDQLVGSGAEQAAKEWAREWALVRASKILGQPVETLRRHAALCVPRGGGAAPSTADAANQQQRARRPPLACSHTPCAA